MLQGISFKIFSMACLLGVLSGILLGDGAFIEFRGEQLRQIIESINKGVPKV